MLDDETVELLGSGCALIVATVTAEGAPHAARGWSLEVVDEGSPTRLRLLLDADDEVSIENIGAGGAIAVTATSVTSLRSIQLKGQAVRLEALTPDDEARAAAYVDHFFAEVHAMDEVTWEQFRCFLPVGHVACTIEAHERYDQTPGPGAGARVDEGHGS